MNALEQAMEVYRKEPCERTFPQDLCLHLPPNGYIVSTPEFLIFGRPVLRHADHRSILDPTHTFKTYDCWFVWLAAGGPITQLLKAMPFTLPWVCFQRKNELRFYKTNDIQRFLSPA